MTIRTKLTVQFTIIVASILLAALFLIYLLSKNYRESEFEGRLEEKATQTATLLFDVDEVDSDLLTTIDDRTKGTLIEERVTIYDINENLLYSSDKDNKLKISQKEIDGLKQDKMIKYEQDEFEILGLHYISSEMPYYIFVGGIDKFGRRKITNLRNTLIVTWVISVLIMSIAGWFFAGRALKPVSNMIQEVDLINDTRLHERIGIGNGKDELARLANTFNNLLNRLESSIASEKNFLANASHELRNPLASITAQLEVCLLNERNSGEYKSTIQSVLEDISALNILTHQLLQLTRIESGITIDSFFKERIDQLIVDATESKMVNQSKLLIEFDFLDDTLKDEAFEVECLRELMLSAFQNLVENAAKFNATKLIIAHRFIDGMHLISFQDNGQGIDESENRKIFDSFYRSKQNSEIDGHGIGLALVNRIITLHKGKISLQSKINQGTTFFIEIPQKLS